MSYCHKIFFFVLGRTLLFKMAHFNILKSQNIRLNIKRVNCKTKWFSLRLVKCSTMANKLFMLATGYILLLSIIVTVCMKNLFRSLWNCFFFLNLAAETGICSWYGIGLDGQYTASGEKFNSHALTAAHKTLPFNTRVKVTIGSRSVVVRINDRGPFVAGRILDVTPAAADRLGLRQKGLAHCTVNRA